MRLKNKVAIVTGGTAGIGRGVAAVYAQEGALTYFTGTNAENGRLVEEEIRQSNPAGKAVFLKADVSSAQDTKSVVETIMKENGRIDILVSNAATSYNQYIDVMTEEQWDHTFAVNLKSVFLYANLIIPIMAKQGGGSIINVGSVTSLTGVPKNPAYVASKTGMVGLTRALAIDHAHQGIRVNIVCPSNVRTPRMERFLDRAPDRETEMKDLMNRHLVKRMSEPEELAEFLVYLASDKAEFLTGGVYPFDGGYTAFKYMQQ